MTAPPGAGGDSPEAQYDAIVSAVSGSPFGPSCGFRTDPDVARVLVVTTDNVFHVPPAPYVHDLTSTAAALDAANITLIGLEADDAIGNELTSLVAATGRGSVQVLSSDGTNIGAAILEGLGNLPVKVEMSSDCSAPINTLFSDNPQVVTSGDDAFFTETISVDALAAGGTYTCTDYVSYNGTQSTTVMESKTIHVPGIELTPPTDTNELGFDLDHTVTATVTAGDFGPLVDQDVTIEIVSGPNTGTSVTGTTNVNGQISLTWTPSVEPSSLGTDDITATLFNPDGIAVAIDDADKDWVDTTPPTASCDPTVNPAGKKIPKAPGNGGQGQNQDGFYQLNGEDVVWPADTLEAFVVDDGTGTVFGPFPVGTNIKYTQDPTGVPEQKKMGNSSDAVVWHIKGQGDAILELVDGSGNIGVATCLVPPPPK